MVFHALEHARVSYASTEHSMWRAQQHNPKYQPSHTRAHTHTHPHTRTHTLTCCSAGHDSPHHYIRKTHMYIWGKWGTRVSYTSTGQSTACTAVTQPKMPTLTHALTSCGVGHHDPHHNMQKGHMHIGERGTRVSYASTEHFTWRVQQEHNPKYQY